jgi:uncharacterized membrane protein
MSVKRIFLYSFLGLFTACQLPAEKRAKQIEQRISDNTQIQAVDSNLAVDTTTLPTPAIPEQKVKSPKGIYQVSLPMEGGVEHTVAFYPNNTYQLQEKYRNDSVVITTGTWAPSNGYIWLYKDQVVRSRYTWSGNQLQYFSPALKKNWSMRHLHDVLQTKTWQNKKGEGVIVFAVGNEPFWSAEINDKDSIAFQLSDWSNALKLKISSAENNKDSAVFTAQNDSTSVRLTVFPYFCSDGMSDMIYKNKVRVQYNNKVFTGCGVNYQ